MILPHWWEELAVEVGVIGEAVKDTVGLLEALGHADKDREGTLELESVGEREAVAEVDRVAREVGVAVAEGM